MLIVLIGHILSYIVFIIITAITIIYLVRCVLDLILRKKYKMTQQQIEDWGKMYSKKHRKS